MVSISQRWRRRSRMTATISSYVSPRPTHQPGLGRHAGVPGLESFQEIERPLVVGAGAGLAIQPRHRLEVVVEHVRRILRETLQRGVHPAAEVGDEDLDAGIRARFAHRSHTGREMARAAVAQVIPIDRGDHHVTQAEDPDRLRQVSRLVGVEGFRPAVRDIAERAPPRAQIAHDHERGGAVGEALREVRAGRLLAHAVQAPARAATASPAPPPDRTAPGPGSRGAFAAGVPRSGSPSRGCGRSCPSRASRASGAAGASCRQWGPCAQYTERSGRDGSRCRGRSSPLDQSPRDRPRRPVPQVHDGAEQLRRLLRVVDRGVGVARIPREARRLHRARQHRLAEGEPPEGRGVEGRETGGRGCA